jgi:hypothetical protein
MVSKTIELICGIDQVQHKFDKHSHDNHAEDPITKKIHEYKLLSSLHL